MPASPERNTTWPSPDFAFDQRRSSNSSFFFPPDQLRQAARMQSLKAAFHRTRPQCSPGPHRPGDALEVLWPEVLKLEQIADKPAGCLRR